MENITDLKVTQIRIFPVDTVPISVMTTKSCVSGLKERMSIAEVEARPFLEGKEVVAFRKGEVTRDDRLIVIDRIEVDPRRIIVEVEGTSDDGDRVYESFLSVVASIASVDSDALRAPLLVAQTTQCIVTLDFAFDALFSDVFMEFLSRKVGKEAAGSIARASVRPLAMVAEITYEIADKALLDNRITMSPKQFTIAPRPGAPAEARKYLTSSPFDSHTHLRLISELNKAVTGSRRA